MVAGGSCDCPQLVTLVQDAAVEAQVHGLGLKSRPTPAGGEPSCASTYF